ncbi:MAG: HPF/RaiA family ribosome-associated protein [Bdellovibrionota bacterium]
MASKKECDKWTCRVTLILGICLKKKGVRRHVERLLRQLEHQFDGIENFHVSIAKPYHHRYCGHPFELRIEVTVFGQNYKVTRMPSADGSCNDLHTLIRSAFDELSHKLDYASIGIHYKIKPNVGQWGESEAPTRH